MLKILTAEQAQERILRSPFNRWLGLHVQSLDATRLVIHCPMRPELLGSPLTGAVHGGVLASLIDTSASLAVMVHTGESVATVDLRTDYHRPATATEFIVQAELVRLGRSIATADARIFDAAGALIASGRAVFMRVAAHPPRVS